MSLPGGTSRRLFKRSMHLNTDPLPSTAILTGVYPHGYTLQS